jgi:hypothetical protein
MGRILGSMAFLAAAGLARAQVTVVDPYTSPTAAQYGKPELVELCRVSANGASYEKRNVRTQGKLDLLEMNRYWSLKEDCPPVLIIPMPTMRFDDLDHLIGKDVEVTGIVRVVPYRGSTDGLRDDPSLPPVPDRANNPFVPEVSITIFSVSDVSASVGKKREEKQRITLERLVKNPGSRDGKIVRVVGKFRGHNLYGDLPVKSQRRSADWVIKDDLFAIWVTGKKPKGSGFDLDASLKRDTGKWLEVVGRPRTIDGVTYLQAEEVLLTTAPSATAEAAPPPPPPEVPKVPPVVVFTLPLDGDDEIASDALFVVQFSKDMDEKTFEGRVQLRYAGPTRPGDRPFDGIRLKYDGGRRALTIDPGDVLRPGRAVEVRLLPGIVDIDGLALQPRPQSRPAGEAVDVLRFIVVS